MFEFLLHLTKVQCYYSSTNAFKLVFSTKACHFQKCEKSGSYTFLKRSLLLSTTILTLHTVHVHFSLPITELTPSAPLALKHLHAAAQTYFNLGISAATRKAYATSLQKYVTFCSRAKLQATPTSRDTLLLFVTHLTQQRLSHATVQVYLSAIRYSHIANREYSKFPTMSLQMSQVLKGICKITSLYPNYKRLVTNHFSNYGMPTICVCKTS